MNILKILTPRRRLGDFGERKAARYLRFRGYRILERNYIGKHGEIDIIARKNNIVAFVEVKTRNTASLSLYEARPAASVTPEKQRRLIRIADEYARRTHKPTQCWMRMDIVEVYTTTDKKGNSKVEKIKHIENAFTMNSAYKMQ